MQLYGHESREWSDADRAAGVVPILVIRNHASMALREVAKGRTLTVLRYGKPVALLAPLAFLESKAR